MWIKTYLYVDGEKAKRMSQNYVSGNLDKCVCWMIHKCRFITSHAELQIYKRHFTKVLTNRHCKNRTSRLTFIEMRAYKSQVRSSVGYVWIEKHICK